MIDGIELDALVKKQTANLMQPQLRDKIEKATRRHFPEGIPAFGTDALRFTFAQLATQGRDIRFDTGRIQGYRNFCNKLWNATRYVLMSVAEQDLDAKAGEAQFGASERWIGIRLGQATERVIQGIADYRFDLAAQALYVFTWDEYCDWYVELSKTTLNDPESSEAQKRGVLQTLLGNLEILLRLLHPFIPFITEELWQKVAPLTGRSGETVMLQPYPTVAEVAGIIGSGSEEGASSKVVADTAMQVDWTQVVGSNADALAEMEWLKAFVLGVRRIRAERDIAPRKPLDIKVKGGSGKEQGWLRANSKQIQTLTSVNDIARVDVEPDDAITAQAGSMDTDGAAGRPDRSRRRSRQIKQATGSA